MKSCLLKPTLHIPEDEMPMLSATFSFVTQIYCTINFVLHFIQT